MKNDYDFSGAKRAEDLPHLTTLRAEHTGKTRITIMLDDDVVEQFRQRARMHGLRYQTEINRALREYLTDDRITLEAIRSVVREELHSDG